MEDFFDRFYGKAIRMGWLKLNLSDFDKAALDNAIASYFNDKEHGIELAEKIARIAENGDSVEEIARYIEYKRGELNSSPLTL